MGGGFWVDGELKRSGRRENGLRGREKGADGETLIADQVSQAFLLSKTKKVDSLTAVRGGGGAEDRMGLQSLRHHVVGRRRLWLGWLVNRRLRGLRGRLLALSILLAALLLRLLHVLDSGAEGALQLRTLFGNIAQHFELLFAEFDKQVDLLLARGNAREQPLGGDHGFQVGPFGAVLGLPVGIQLVPEPGVVRGVFVGEDGGAGAQAVGEGVEADGVLALICFWTGRLLSILPVGLVLLLRNYRHVNDPFLGLGFNAPTPIQ